MNAGGYMAAAGLGAAVGIAVAAALGKQDGAQLAVAAGVGLAAGLGVAGAAGVAALVWDPQSAEIAKGIRMLRAGVANKDDTERSLAVTFISEALKEIDPTNLDL